MKNINKFLKAIQDGLDLKNKVYLHCVDSRFGKSAIDDWNKNLHEIIKVVYCENPDYIFLQTSLYNEGITISISDKEMDCAKILNDKIITDQDNFTLIIKIENK